MANKGPVKANRNTSHLLLFWLFISFDWRVQCITPFEDFAALRIMLSSLHDPRARSINLLERFFFFIGRVHLGVPNGKRVIEIHHYQSH